MARFDTSGFDDIVKQIVDLGEAADDAADKMLLAGATVVKEAWQEAAEHYGHKDTGDMINSIGFPKKTKKADGVRSIEIYPQGKDRKGVRNAEKAFVLNFGTSSIKGTRFVDRAETKSAEEVERVMRETWEKELRKKGL